MLTALNTFYIQTKKRAEVCAFLFERDDTELHFSFYANVEHPANNIAAVKGHLIVLLKVLCTHSQ